MSNLDHHNQTPAAASSAPATVMARPNDSNSPGSSGLVVKSFEGFLSFVIEVSIFGASTFTVIVSEIANPADLPQNPRFGQETVRNFVALAWLLFIIALCVTGFSITLLTFQREAAIASFGDEWEAKCQRLGLAAFVFLQGLIIGAFMFLSLAVAAYTETVGWIAVAFTSAAGILAFSMLL